MSEDAISLITELLAKHAAETRRASLQAKRQYLQDTAEEGNVRKCVDAILEDIRARHILDEFRDYFGREVQSNAHRR